jgi:hypothetical protein
MEYWHDIQTEKSWRILQSMKGKFPFVLIGGWAVYLWTRSQKSKDIDIIVDIPVMAELKKRYDVRKNDRLKKYEIKIDEIDVDIYVKHYSELAVPVEMIETAKIEGFEVARPEFLLALKQGAEQSRGESIKGEKDRIDIMSLLLKCGVDFPAYKRLLERAGRKELFPRLVSIVKGFDGYEHLGLNPRQFKLEKKSLLEKMRQA